jgi:hypothetical protein
MLALSALYSRLQQSTGAWLLPPTDGVSSYASCPEVRSLSSQKSAKETKGVASAASECGWGFVGRRVGQVELGTLPNCIACSVCVATTARTCETDPTECENGSTDESICSPFPHFVFVQDSNVELPFVIQTDVATNSSHTLPQPIALLPPVTVTAW